MRASVQWDTADPTIIAEPALFLPSPHAAASPARSSTSTAATTPWAHQHPPERPVAELARLPQRPLFQRLIERQ